jgi:hypothetical protein
MKRDYEVSKAPYFVDQFIINSFPSAFFYVRYNQAKCFNEVSFTRLFSFSSIFREALNQMLVDAMVLSQSGSVHLNMLEQRINEFSDLSFG